MSNHPGLRQPSFFERKREKEARRLEPVEFMPVRRNPLVPQTKIRMINSVHGKFQNGKHFNLEAGEEYWVDQAKADQLIIKGYAAGKLSRNYTEMEKSEFLAQVQRIDMNEVKHG